MNISVTADVKGARRYLDQIGERGVARAAMRALNRSAASTNTQVRRSIAKEIDLPAKEIKDRLVVVKASPGRLLASVAVTKAGRRPLNLIHWVAKGNRTVGAFSKRAGVAYKMGTRKTLAGSFIAAPRGVPLVFIRKGTARLPIVAKTGPSIASVFNREDVQAKAEAIARAAFVKEFDRQLARELDKARAKTAI